MNAQRSNETVTTVQCQGCPPDTFAYFFQAERKHVQCKSPATWVVSVNPPSERSDGKVRLCDHCNEWEYRTFPRVKL